MTCSEAQRLAAGAWFMNIRRRRALRSSCVNRVQLSITGQYFGAPCVADAPDLNQEGSRKSRRVLPRPRCRQLIHAPPSIFWRHSEPSGTLVFTCGLLDNETPGFKPAKDTGCQREPRVLPHSMTARPVPQIRWSLQQCLVYPYEKPAYTPQMGAFRCSVLLALRRRNRPNLLGR
jgi:hypothetical protein